MLNRKILFLFFIFMTCILGASEEKSIAFYTKNVARASEKDVKLAISQILKANTRHTDLTVNEVFPDSIDETINGFLSKRYALITINVIDFLKNYNTMFPLSSRMWTLSKNDDKKYSTYMIVIKKDDDIKSFKFKSVALLRFNKMQEIFLDSFLLKKYHHGIDYFFSKKVFFDFSSKMLIKLFFSKVDACVVSKAGWDIAVEMNPQLKEKFNVLQVSKPIYPDIGLTVLRKGEKRVGELYSEIVRKKISIAKINSVLMIYKAKAIVEYDKSGLKELYGLYMKYLKLKKKYE